MKKLYFEDKTARQVAAEMEFPTFERVYKTWQNARRRLLRDKILKRLRGLTHDYHIIVGASRFNITHTSAVEESVIRYEHEKAKLRSFLHRPE